MKLKASVISILILFIFCGITYADRELSDSEIQKLFQKLISSSKTTWISAGTIEAIKEEYRAPEITNERLILSEISKKIEEYQNNTDKAERAEYLQKMALDAIPFNVRYRLSNEYKMKTKTFLKYDGQRYYCDITVESREDSVKIPDELRSNYKTEEFNLSWNGRRIICFDGEKSVMYTPTINHAIIEPIDRVPSGSISLLTKGLILWGYGSLTLENLNESKYSAEEKIVDGRTEVHIRIVDKYDKETLIVLDPRKAYAPLSFIVNSEDSSVVNLYSDYKLISDSWVPTSIIIEKFDSETNKLLTGDYITITSINDEIPAETSFNIDFLPNTLVEHTYDITKPQLKYFYSKTANTDLLFVERLAYIESEKEQTQNCATSALQFAAFQLGKDILNQRLSELVSPDDLTTSIIDLQKYAEDQGFYCRTVKTDIQALKDLTDCKAILHIPSQNHFVLLDHIDQNYVWIIDLTKDKFYYRVDINFFSMDWTEGTALLVSNKPITVSSETVAIPDEKLAELVGGYGYSCTYQIQNIEFVRCVYDGQSTCMGNYEFKYPRMGCEFAESGSCTQEFMSEKITWPCIFDPTVPNNCLKITSEPQYFFILACK